MLLWLMFAQLVFAAEDAKPPTAVVTKSTGTVRFEGRRIDKGYVIEYPGTILTEERSYVQLTIEKWNSKINIGPNSSLRVDLNGDKKYVFEKGNCRWTHRKRTVVDPKAPKGSVHTRNASMDIRGTDFILKANADLGETELYLLDGQIQIENAANKLNAFLVKPGQWVGIGGRFGANLSDPIQLPETMLKRLRTELEW